MDIKDSYLHGTVGVVKSISVSADKLKYRLADIAGTVKEITLPVATTSANGLMSSGDKTKLDNLSSTIGNYVTLNTDQEITGTKTFTKQLKFTVADGTAPFTVSSTTKVSNLNADLLDGFGESAFLKDRGLIKADTIETTLTNGIYYTSEFSPINGGYNYGSVLNFRSYPTLTLFYMSDGAQSKPRIWYRNKWNSQDIINTSWLEILTSNSYTNYTVGKDGTGATGTWGINITGNAATATKLQTKRKLWGLNFDGSADVSGSLTGVTSINMNGDIVINDGINHDRYIKWLYNNTDNYGWRIGYLGSKGGDDNDLTFDSHRKEAGWASALYFKHTTLNAHFAGTVVAPTFQGNLDGTYINKLTGYSKATAIAALAATDSLNTALGKLEYKADVTYDLVKGAYDGDGTIENLTEILKVLEGIKDTETIKAIIGKYLPLTGGTLDGSLYIGKADNTDYKYLQLTRSLHGLRINNLPTGAYISFGSVNNENDFTAEKSLLLGDSGLLYTYDLKTWHTIIHSDNYTTYTVKKDGTGASGTWGINITGNATSATNIYVNQHTANDIEYPLVWSNKTDTTSAQANQLYKSYSNLLYNPKNNRITASIFKGNLQGNINPFTNISFTAGTSTVKNVKDALVTAFNSMVTGIGANVIVPAYAINYWSTESTVIQNSNVYSMIKIGGGYSGTTYGLWLLSTYASNRIGYVGRNNSTWDNIYWLATTSDIDTLKNYYWANVKISATSNAATTPTFATATATTQVTTPKVHSNGRLTLNTTDTGLDLKWNNDNAKSVILNGTAFKPFDDANNNLTLGSASARWSTIYGVNGNFSGTIKMYTGDASLAIYSGRITDAKSDGNICFLTSIDNTDPQSHAYPTQHGARCNIVLQPRGGLVYIGTNPDGGNTAYKLYVNGNTFASGYVKSGSSDSYVLLGGGGHKALNDFSMAHSHPYLATAGGTMTGLLTLGANSYNKTIKWANTDFPQATAIAFMGSSGDWVVRSTYASDSSTADLRFNKSTLQINGNIALHTGNSSVSGGGSSGGSSITVNIGGTSKTLTIPSSLPANGGSANKLNSANLKSTSGLHYYYAGGITTSTDNTGNYVGPNSNTIYSSVLRLQSHTTAGALYYRDLIFDVNSDSIWSRRVTNSGTPSLVSILHSGNSSVSGGGSSWGSSITVKINDTTATLTIPSNPNTDTKVTNTLAATTKFYLTGTSSASTNTGTLYFDTGIYSTTTAGLLFTTSLVVNSKLSIDSTGRVVPASTSVRNAGVYGVYDSLKVGHVWSMGTSYAIAADGSNTGSMYGLVYFHTNWSNDSTKNDASKTEVANYASGHLIAMVSNGSVTASLGTYVWSRGGFKKNGSSDSYVLLGGGGHKAVSDFWTGTRYWANVAVSTSSSTTTTPTFAKVSISNSTYNLMTLTRSGSTNGALIAFANSNGTLGHIGMTGAVNGGLCRYSADAASLYLVCDLGNSSVSGGGSSWGSSITVNIGGTSKTLTIPANPNTWRPITDSYSGTTTTTSLSQKGANDLYNAVIGMIPTVNNGKITIKLNGTEIGSFTMNQSSAGTINLTDTTYGLVGANGTTGLIKNGSTVTTTTGYIACPIINGVPYYWDTTLGNSGVTAGTYTPTPSTVTNSTNQSIQVPELTINASGLITKASLKNVAITGSFYIASNKTLTNSELSFITSITIAPGYTVTFPTPSSSNEGKIIFVKAAYGNQARYVSGKLVGPNLVCSTAATSTVDIGYNSYIFVCMDYGSGYAWVWYYCG